MIYEAGLPLNFFEHFAVRAFFHRLRPVYKLLCRKRLSTTLLDESHQSVETEVEEYLEKQDNLYISFDESNDVANNRIMNISITTERGAFYYKNIDLGATTVNAEFCAKKIEQQARSITKEQLKRINSISTDTCDTILKTAHLL
jgi:hypothetical protein